MCAEEWLQIGYEKGLIEDIPEKDRISFEAVYRSWFKTKIARIRPQSVDRIEVTYNRYFKDTGFAETPVHQLTEAAVYRFLNGIILRHGITYKEYQRIYQIANNVLTYAGDTGTGTCRPLNWNVVRRYIAVDKFAPSARKEYCISMSDRQTLFRAVLAEKIYPEKRSAALCLVLNFYLGLRIGELAGLRWQDVNLAEKYVYIHATQTKAYRRDADGARTSAAAYFMQDRTKTVHSVRRIPLVRESIHILQILKAWHESQGYDSAYLAYDGTDTILSKSLERTLRRLCALCDVTYFSSHKIRKTFASELHRNGAPTKMISEIMGHAEMRTTERSYIVSYTDTLDAIRDVMQRGLVVPL